MRNFCIVAQSRAGAHSVTCGHFLWGAGPVADHGWRHESAGDTVHMVKQLARLIEQQPEDAGHADVEHISGCPHVDRNDSRCSHRFRLGRLDQAMCVCFGSYHGCPMYHRINRETGGSIADALPPEPLRLQVTVHAQLPALRRIGT